MVVTSTAAWAQSPAAVSSPVAIGSPVTIVADETVDPRVRPGSEFRAHLRDPLTLGGTLVATAGTPARLVVTAKETGKDGTPRYHIAIIGLHLGLAGTLPVKPVMTTVERIVTGMDIAATTLASIGYEAGKIRVAIPLPFKLSNDPPIGAYTPTPLRTAAPIVNRRKPSASPSPVASPTTPASPVPTSAPTLVASPTPPAVASPASN